MEDERNIMRDELESLEEEIEDLEKRLPAHSVKPAMIIELEKLEEKRDALIDRLKKMEAGG